MEKKHNDFGKDKNRKDGLHCHCRSCVREYYKKYWVKYYLKRKDKKKEQYLKSREERIEYARQYKKSPRGRASNLARLKTKRKNRPEFRLSQNMSRRLRKSLNGERKTNRWENVVGYTLFELKGYLEKLFQEGMSWDNYGEWHIDHIIPIAVFNFKKEKDIDFKRCWALENLQPLWAKDNLCKQAKLEKAFQPSLAL